MRNMFTKLALASAALFGLGSSANAFVIVSLKDLTNPLSEVICDTSAAVSATNCGAGFTVSNSNKVIFDGTVGNFLVDISSGTNNFPGNSTEAFVTSSTLNVTNLNAVISGIDQLYVNVRSFGFTMPADEFKTFYGNASLSSTLPGIGGSVQSDFTADPLNAGTPFANLITCTQVVTAAANSCNTGAPIIWQDDPLGPVGFSIRTEQYIKLEGQARVGTTATATVGTIPEPMTTSLVGGALLALALSSRRRSRKV